MIIPVILAGGSGTRLWPLSRELYPKQLLPLLGSRTLLQNTAMRFSRTDGIAAPIVICNEIHRFLVAEQFRTIGIKPASIILEPVGRNTAPAITVAALAASALDPEAVLLVLPADHHLAHLDVFFKAVETGALLSRQGHLVTFGIVPSSPETGYGYIQKGEPLALVDDECEAVKIRRFVEKPNRETAQNYLASGEYLWNSGMFMFLASCVLEELERFAPTIVQACRKAYEKQTRDLDFCRLDKESFEESPTDSIDYAVMEKTDRGAMVPLSAGWNDVGCWSSLWEIGAKDPQRNVTVGDVIVHDVEGCYLHSTGRLIAAIGLRNHVVVETTDAVFISPWDRTQDVKVLVQKLREGGREEAISHKKVYRPWGTYENISVGDRFQVKRITVKQGAKLSVQRHHHRAEHWIVVKGTALVTKGEEQFIMKEDESTYIPLGVKHSLENPGKIPLEIIEVQSGSYLGEDDIVRFEDVYGRN